MDRVLQIFAMTFFVVCSVAASENFKNSVLKGQVEHAELTQLRQYKNFQYDLMYLVANLNESNNVNHFCIVGYRWPDKSVEAVVYWKERQRLTIWPGRKVPPEEYGDDAKDFLMTKSIDITHNIVDREDQMTMATYLRRDLEGTLEDCARHGIQYELKPFTPPPEDSEDDW